MVQNRNGRLYIAAFSAILGSFVYGYSMVLPSAVIPQVQEDDDPSMHMNVDQISWFGVYVSEISHAGVRGFLGSSPQIMIVIGGLALYALDLVLPWRWLAVVGEVPVLIMLILMCFMPNSPRYLITNNKRNEADRALKWLRGHDLDPTDELNQIQHSIESQAGMQWSDLKSPFLYKPILISMLMRFLQQMTGITSILVYLEPIFEKTAVSLAPKYDAAIVGFVRLVTVIIAAGLMDKAGKKSLLYISGNSGNVTVEALSSIEPYEAINSITVIPLISIIFITLEMAGSLLLPVLGSFIFGYSMVLPSAVIPQVQNDDDPSILMQIYQISWFGVYVSEISHPGVRGYLGSTPQIMTVIGGLVLYVLCLVLPWRWLAVAGEVPVVIILFLLCFMPNSPRYLITNNRCDEAGRDLQWLRGPDSNYTAELNRIRHSVNSQVAFGLFAPFLFFGVVCVVNIFTAKCVPETKGRSLEEIENYFKTGHTFTISESCCHVPMVPGEREQTHTQG
ncbi:hypothetical protein QTP86_009700 [Hemibagrus guttatus]|nr:hypothetical protein QTP86_009700 [Hemibagrus guttatus]